MVAEKQFLKEDFLRKKIVVGFIPHKFTVDYFKQRILSDYQFYESDDVVKKVVLDTDL